METEISKSESTPQEEIVAVEKSISLEELQNLARVDKRIKSWLDSEKDKYHVKATETYKSNGNFVKDFEKYAIEKGLLPDPDIKATPEEIEQAGVLEKKIQKIQSDTIRNERTLAMLQMLDKAEIKGWNTQFIEKLIDHEDTDEYEMAKIVDLLKEFDEKCRSKINRNLPQVSNKNEPSEDTLTREEFMDLPYKERVQMITTEPEKYKTIMESEK